MLEKMDKFFESRLDGYEEHMLTNIESAAEFYPFTADCLPDTPGARVLDLGCGTGLELNWYCISIHYPYEHGLEFMRLFGRKPGIICVKRRFLQDRAAMSVSSERYL